MQECGVQETLVLAMAAIGTEQNCSQYYFIVCSMTSNQLVPAVESSQPFGKSRISDVDSEISCGERLCTFCIGWFSFRFIADQRLLLQTFPRCCWIRGLVQVPHPSIFIPFIELHIGLRPNTCTASALGTSEAVRQNVSKCDVRVVACVWG